MWLMLQEDSPDDYVIATGTRHSVRELLEAAFGFHGLDYRDYVTVDPRFLRPADVIDLVGDSSKARRELGWEPKVTFEELIEMMAESDLQDLKRRLDLGLTIT
jgi:GDPmannose 4,6-dehydratase